MKVLFVCTGNTCRSPMAEGFMRYYKALYELKIETGSRGIMAREDALPAEYSVEAMKRYDVDISGHRASGLKQHEIDEDTVLITMTDNHKLFIKQNYITEDQQLFTLTEYLGKTGDIGDPFGMPQGVYDQCAGVLKELVEELAKQLKATID